MPTPESQSGQEPLFLPADRLYWCNRRPLDTPAKPKELEHYGYVAKKNIDTVPEDVRAVLEQQYEAISSGATKIIFPVRFYGQGLSHTNSLQRRDFATYFGIRNEEQVPAADLEPRSTFGRKLASLFGRNRTP